MKSELFIECAKNVVDFYNLTQESIGSKNRMEYPKVIEEKKPREWWIGVQNMHTTSYPFTEEEKHFIGDYKEIIKVREVIE